MMTGCSEPKDMNRIEQFVLRNENTIATLDLPAAYKAKTLSTDGVQFRCKYPSMEPSDSEMEVAEMTVTVTLVRPRKNLYELAIEEAKNDHYDPERPGAMYRAGTKGKYKIFHRGQPSIDPKNFDTYYLFQANDGQWVKIDASDSGTIYRAERPLIPEFFITYWFVKSKSTEFVHIDEVVTSFLSNRLKSQSINRQGKQ